ncbi:MAG: SAM hydroxide adenosyltransferase, partial [Acidimicrobiales bacterium]
VPLSRQEDGKVVGEVLWVDHFGNAQLNVGPDDLAGMDDHVSVRIGEKTRAAVRVASFAELRQGQVGLIVDSYGLMAVVLQKRSAAEELRLAAGDGVTLEAAE